MKKIIVITGPTGVGKTKLSVKLAKKLKGEIINADSMQVYRGLDIGTAKIKDVEKETAKYKFSVINSCLFYFKIVIFDNGFGAVILTVNHLIADSWSLGLVIQDILKEYHNTLNRNRIWSKFFVYRLHKRRRLNFYRFCQIL